MAAKYKFEFGTDFQELILQYTVTDHKGYKVLELYEDSYFTLIHHAVIAYTLKKYYKKEKHIPEEPYLREYLRRTYQYDKIVKLNLTEEDREIISEIIKKLYQKPVAHPDSIIEQVINFARYVGFKNELEQVDIDDYTSYEKKIDSFRKAVNIGLNVQEDYGTFLISGMKDRAHKRDNIHRVTPTPFWQMNRLLNSGGTEEGNVITVMAREKFFKTGFLINAARGYASRQKKGFYADLENGEVTITMRTEQSFINVEQHDILSGEMDNKLLKLFRKYNRLKSELVIKKFPNLKTTCDDLQRWLDKLYRDFGFKADYGMIDYGPLLGSISGKTDDFNRISDSFLDIKNLADYNKLDAIWTCAHVGREGNKRVGTKFQSTDIAKCIDIPRHIDALLGLQQNDEEKENGVMRMEVIEQRNGMQNGKMLFWVDIAKQRMKEFTKPQVREYLMQTKDTDNEDIRPKRKKVSDL